MFPEECLSSLAHSDPARCRSPHRHWACPWLAVDPEHNNTPGSDIRDLAALDPRVWPLGPYSLELPLDSKLAWWPFKSAPVFTRFAKCRRPRGGHRRGRRIPPPTCQLDGSPCVGDDTTPLLRRSTLPKCKLGFCQGRPLLLLARAPEGVE